MLPAGRHDYRFDVSRYETVSPASMPPGHHGSRLGRPSAAMISKIGAVFVKPDIASASDDDQTDVAFSKQAGAEILLLRPLLQEEIKTVIPASTAKSTAAPIVGHSESQETL